MARIKYRAASTHVTLGALLIAFGASCDIDQTTEVAGDSSAGGAGGTVAGGGGGFPWVDAGGAAGSGGVSGAGLGGIGATGGVAGAGGTAGVSGAGGTTGWSPASIAGCVLWLDAANPTALNAPGGAVQEWQDNCSSHAAKSGGNNRPQLTPQLLNGLPGVKFDGVDDFLEIGGTSTDSGSYSLFFVVRVNQVSQQRPVWSNRAIVSTGATFFGHYNGKGYLYQNTASPAGLNATTVLPTEAMLYELLVNAGSRTILVNGAPAVSDGASGSTTSVPNGFLGWDKTNNAFLAMDLFEAIAFDQAISAPDATIVRTKLKEKWDLP